VLAAFRYRIYPKPGQERLLKSHLSALCRLYNELRDLKIEKWRRKRASLSENDLRQTALEMRRKDEDLKSIHSQVVQNVATRVSTAFRNYLEGRARFPKHKKIQRYRSFTYPQSGFRLCGKIIEKGSRTELNGKLYLSKIGFMRIFMHKPLNGRMKSLTVKYDAGEWYIVFACEVQDRSKTPLEEVPQSRIKGGRPRSAAVPHPLRGLPPQLPEVPKEVGGEDKEAPEGPVEGREGLKELQEDCFQDRKAPPPRKEAEGGLPGQDYSRPV